MKLIHEGKRHALLLVLRLLLCLLLGGLHVSKELFHQSNFPRGAVLLDLLADTLADAGKLHRLLLAFDLLSVVLQRLRSLSEGSCLELVDLPDLLGDLHEHAAELLVEVRLVFVLVPLRQCLLARALPEHLLRRLEWQPAVCRKRLVRVTRVPLPARHVAAIEGVLQVDFDAPVESLAKVVEHPRRGLSEGIVLSVGAEEHDRKLDLPASRGVRGTLFAHHLIDFGPQVRRGSAPHLLTDSALVAEHHQPVSVPVELLHDLEHLGIESTPVLSRYRKSVPALRPDQSPIQVECSHFAPSLSLRHPVTFVDHRRTKVLPVPVQVVNLHGNRLLELRRILLL
mmetsp:Transcript_14345/g.40792  ORF Transcript_14345/g.40792 Transcript_14345/m.40792 type:complete len:340 (-) Transcript_14345:451-1470(-)